MGIMIIGFVVMAFIAYMLVRNNAVADARIVFIKFFYEEDHDGYAAGRRLHESLPSYDEMLWKFWVWPLSKFYPAYRNRNRNK